MFKNKGNSLLASGNQVNVRLRSGGVLYRLILLSRILKSSTVSRSLRIENVHAEERGLIGLFESKSSGTVRIITASSLPRVSLSCLAISFQ